MLNQWREVTEFEHVDPVTARFLIVGAGRMAGLPVLANRPETVPKHSVSALGTLRRSPLLSFCR